MTKRSVRGPGRVGRWPAALLLTFAPAVGVWQLATAAAGQATTSTATTSTGGQATTSTGGQATTSTGGQATMPAATVSQYETTTDPAVLFAQGAWAGQVSSQGLVILDFGRPAASGATLGTVTEDDTFASLTSIATGAESYIDGYFQQAPDNVHLYVAIGTNNSCGTDQPCGNVVCGCSLEPTSYSAWGAALAATVESVQGWATALKQRWGFTDVVTVVAGDDIEPAYDPGYFNTYDLLSGYAAAVGGYQPAMIDYGSAEPGYWSQTQLLQVANGFKPDVLVPQLYYPAFVNEWATLLSYARSQGQAVTMFGVLTDHTAGNSASASYTSMLNALASITGQSGIRWVSTIGPS